MKFRIKIKVIDREPMPDQNSILKDVIEVYPELLCDNMLKIREGSLLFVKTKDQVMDLLSNNIQEGLKRKGLMAMNPDWLIPAHTLFANKIPEAISEFTNQELFNEILRVDPNIGIKEAIVMPNQSGRRSSLKSIKLIFSDTDAYNCDTKNLGVTLNCIPS